LENFRILSLILPDRTGAKERANSTNQIGICSSRLLLWNVGFLAILLRAESRVDIGIDDKRLDVFKVKPVVSLAARFTRLFWSKSFIVRKFPRMVLEIFGFGSWHPSRFFTFSKISPGSPFTLFFTFAQISSTIWFFLLSVNFSIGFGGLVLVTGDCKGGGIEQKSD